MKKRLIALTAALCACVCALFACVACTGNASHKGSSTNAPLTYGKRYLFSEDIGKDAQHYLIFEADGTGTYTVVDEYRIRFTYLYTDSGLLHCFYHSLSGDVNSYSAPELAKWTKTYFPSPEVLYEDTANGGEQYICETYLPNIPNFGKYKAD